MALIVSTGIAGAQIVAPEQLPEATTSQTPPTAAYDLVGVPSLGPGSFFLDPTTGVRAYKLTDSSLPVPGAQGHHDSAEGGNEVPWNELAFTFSNNPATAHGSAITFVRTTEVAIPLPDESVNVVYSVHTMEHLSRAREMLLECHRILRPGGRLLLRFQPWLSPCGSHPEDVIPVPWAHVLFSMRSLLSVAAYLYDSDEHFPAWYWRDEGTGARRANPYLDQRHWEGAVARLVSWQSSRECRSSTSSS